MAPNWKHVQSNRMTDTRTPAQRRRIMQSVGQKKTKPEMKVRRYLHSLGYRYRSNMRGLPGKPDLAFTSRKKAIFVHGCFWHGHGCSKGKLPKSRLDYWKPKIESNIARDAVKSQALQDDGWSVMVLWQCELSGETDWQQGLREFLGPPKYDRQSD